jgi:hypothetical protein
MHRSDKVKTCYSRAVAVREQSLRSPDPVQRARLLKIEYGWISLAQSYQLTESLEDFGEEIRRYLQCRIGD